MSVNLETNACDAEQLEAFLRGSLNDAAERALLLHLDSFGCRRALHQQAAEPAAWQEAEELLRPCEFDAPTDRASESAEQTALRPLLIQGVLDALGPTDDPAMLGRLAGYEISGVVGAGGMGVVLKALDRSLDRTVAIKVLAPHLAASGAARKRFAREAKAAAAVLHPNVIAIHGVSQDSPLPYLVMPYLRGTSLQKRLDEQGPLPLPEVLRIGAQIAAGLAAAHAQGLVHRDIKPANILLEEGVERVAITDFGLARAVDDATLTTSGVIAGTPQYMSPEQARGEPVDQRSDLFSLGSVLYAACAGRPPFRAETSHGVLRRITDDEPTAIREINPEIPEWLAAIVARLMAKKAIDRFASAGEVAELLEKCLAHIQQPAKVPLPADLPRGARLRAWRPSYLSVTGVVAMIAAAGIALLGITLLAADPPDIAGEWTGSEWGQVVLKKLPKDHYTGTYTDTFGAEPGKIALKWSRVERRFNGTWSEGKDRFGKLSVRLVGEEIRGAHTTDRDSKISPGIPRLADLAWRRVPKEPEPPKSVKNAKPVFGPVREGVLPYGLPCEQQYFQFASGKVFVVGHGPATSGEEFDEDRKKMEDAGGADISIGSNVGIQLVGEGCIFSQDFFGLHWDKFTAEQVVDSMRHVNFSFGVVEHAKKDLPLTYLFKTSRDEVGILELLAIVDDGRGLHALGNGLKFRYKLVQADATTALEGDWRLKSITGGGVISYEKGLSVRVRGDQWTIIRQNSEAPHRLVLNAEGNRQALDLVAQRDSLPPLTYRGLFHLRGDTLTIAWGPRPSVRPTDFDGVDGGLHTWKRIKPEGSGSTTSVAAGETRPMPAVQGTITDLIEQELVEISVGADDGLRVKDELDVHRDTTYLGKLTVLRAMADRSIARIESRQGEFRRGDQVRSKTSAPAAGGPQRARHFSTAASVSKIAYSADGKLLAVAGEPVENELPAVQIVNAATGDILRTLKLTSAEEDAVLAATERVNRFDVSALAFAPAGDVLAVGTGIGQAKLFHPRTGELIRALDDQGLRLADKETPENWKPMVRAIGSVQSLAFTPDGSRLAICGDSFADFSDVFDGIENLRLATTGPGRLKVFDVQNGKLVHDLAGHSQARAVAISAEGEWLASAGSWAGGSDHGSGVIVWNLQTGEKRTTLLQDTNGGTLAVAFSPKQKLIAIASLQFDKENDTRSTVIRVAFPLSGITEWQQTIAGWAGPEAFSPDGKSLLLLCEGQSIRVVNVATGQLQHEIIAGGEGSRWTGCAVSPVAPELAIGGSTAARKGFLDLYTLPPSVAAEHRRQ